MGRQHQGMDRPGVREVPEGSGEQGKIEKTGSKINCGAPTTLPAKGLMMMMMMMPAHPWSRSVKVYGFDDFGGRLKVFTSLCGKFLHFK